MNEFDGLSKTQIEFLREFIKAIKYQTDGNAISEIIKDMPWRKDNTELTRYLRMRNIPNETRN